MAKKGKGPGSKSSASGPSGGQRQLHVRVKTARRRTASSARWLERQLNDPYVAASKREGMRSRAAYKLMEIDDKYKFLRPGMRVVDLGAAPGGWSQVSAERVRSLTKDPRQLGESDAATRSQAPEDAAADANSEDSPTEKTDKSSASHDRHPGQVVAIDYLGVEPLPGVELFEMDFMEEGAEERLKAALRDGGADVVLSDMAAPTVGHKGTDHLRIISLAEAAAHFACDVLSPGGAFLCKVFQGGAERDLLDLLRQRFKTVRHVKPPASRADSAELYVLATGFRPAAD